MKKIIRSFKSKQDFKPNYLGVLVNPYFITRHNLFKYIKKLSTKFIDGKLLDFGCGSKPYKFLFKVDEYIGLDTYKSGHLHKNENIDVLYDGKKIPFDDNSFDVGIEYGALHHVDLDAALAELARVLKPEAKMLCVEALRHNPIIHLYRKRTPHLRTEWEVEHILGIESFKIMEKYFEKIDVRFFHLTALGLVPFRKTFLFPLLLPVFNFIDRILLSSQLIGKFGWIMAVELSHPKK